MTDPTEALAERLERVIAALPEDHATSPVTVATWEVPGEPPAPADALAAARFEPATIGDPWGPAWGTTWFRLRGTVPPAWRDGPVEVHLDLGFSFWPPGFQCEGLVVDAAGRPVRGVHPRARRWLVSSHAEGGEAVEAFVEAAANPSVTSFTAGGADAVNRVGGEPLYRLARAELARPDLDARALAADLDVLRTLLLVRRRREGDDPRRTAIESVSDAVCDLLEPDHGASSRAAARALVAPVLAVPAEADAPRLSLVAHAHLDTAWLWPLRETVRKAVRTYANVLSLMRDDEAMTFAGSQAAQHAWVRDRHPGLWADVVDRAREGRWVPVGGMWVEPDVLLPSGESLARQLVAGQRFFGAELGREARTGWLPDSFGCSPALPQLLRAAGINAFVTQKLSWNDTNRFPYTTFWWEGLDGSRVLTHFPTVDTYNAELSADDMARARSRDDVADSLVPFGHGDGGGGPTATMLARARRMHDLDGVPRAVHTDPDVFVAGLPRVGLPTWRGDLYLETHRGVWTSQRRTKLGDARCDEALRSAESWCAAAAVRADHPYPQQELDALWHRHLLLEFHDILPGSSITQVHREAEAPHAEVLEEALRLRAAAVQRLGGRTVPTATGPLAGPQRDGDVVVLDNGRVRAVVGADGHVRSLVDRASGHELVPTGASFGALHLHPDDPTVFDAWNLDRSVFERYDVVGPAGEVRIEDDGVVVDRRLPGSHATVRWTLPEDAAALRLSIEVDWRESQRCLRLALPFDLRPPFLSAGVQNGWVARTLHRNTTWEQARYEDWFHGALHLLEGRTGVAVVTADCHGYGASSRVREDGGTTTDVGLTLLRAPAFPDPTCDLGRHTLQVDVLLDCGLAEALGAGRAARSALIPGIVGTDPLASASGHGVSLDAVKLADDGSGDIVLRLHEETGGRVEAVVDVAVPVASSARCDLLERPLGAADAVEGRTVRLPLRPFELVTLRLERA